MTRLSSRVDERNRENHDDESEREPFGKFEFEIPLGVKELDEELDATAHPLKRNGWKLDAAAGLAEKALEAVQ